MSRRSVTQQNFSGGELSPGLAGRFDLGVYYNGASWMQNMIATVQGMGKFRSGTKFVWNTRDNAAAVLIPFEYNTEQAYVLEFTDQKMRIIKDGGIVTETAQDITGITNANPAVVTYSGSDNYANGDRVIISGVVGMAEVNNQEFTVANVDTGNNTFELSGIDSTSYGTYSSGGSVAEIVEVTTPYTEADLFELDYAQTNDTMYITHPDYAPRKLTRSSHTAWTLSTFTIVGNPFGTTKASGQSITGITKANPAVVTYSGSDNYANGDTVYISGVVGMTQVNGRNFTVANVNTGANTFELQEVDSTNYTAYTSGGTIEEFTAFSYPAKVAFFEQRLIYAASDSKPQTLWGSVGDEDGYDNFNTGTGDSDAFIYRLSSGQGNRILWLEATEDFLAIGTAGSEFKAEGGNNEPITPTNVSIKPPSFYGSADIKPIRLDSHILYVQRDSLTMRSFEFDAIQDGFTSINRTLVSDQILMGRYGKSNGAKQIAFQSGSPSINWVVRNDGALCGLTFEPREQVNGWHRHYAGGALTGGKNGKPEYESVATISQAQAPDQVYMVVQRTINGSTVRYIEYFADQPNIPRFIDYYTGDKDADTEAFLQDMWEAQKRLFYVDCGLSIDGTVEQTMTLSATTGSGVTATAGGATFSSTDVGREIWGKEGGRAVITAYTSATVVTVTVKVDFPAVSIASGDWYLTFSTVSGFEHLEGENVIALVDGGVVENLVVEDAAIDLGQQASYATVGLKYIGIYESMDLEIPGDNGAGMTKRKSLSQVGIRFLDSLGIKIGTDLYKLDDVIFRKTSDKMNRPPPLFSGIKVKGVRDNWGDEKRFYVLQDKPLPCNFQLFNFYGTVNDG